MICDIESTLLPEWDEQAPESCAVDYCKTLMDIARKESCGKCVLCREGTWQVYEILQGITEGHAQSEDFELMTELLKQIRDHVDCEMTQEAAWRSLELIQKDPEVWDQHIRRKRCSNLVCKSSYTLYIDPALCDGCGVCLPACGAGAIAGGQGLIHVIDTGRCQQSLGCLRVCPKGAIKKAGAVKPKIPGEPIPVGSFSESSDDGDGSPRRRRRKA